MNEIRGVSPKALDGLQLTPIVPRAPQDDLSGGAPISDPARFTSEPVRVPRSNILVDSHGRTIRDLRISITDRCNFRCLYCLPETEAAHNFYRGRWANLPNSAPILRQWAPKSHLLTFEEIERVVRLAAALGIQKIRLTGGEPLLRQCVE